MKLNKLILHRNRKQTRDGIPYSWGIVIQAATSMYNTIPVGGALPKEKAKNFSSKFEIWMQFWRSLALVDWWQRKHRPPQCIEYSWKRNLYEYSFRTSVLSENISVTWLRFIMYSWHNLLKKYNIKVWYSKCSFATSYPFN